MSAPTSDDFRLVSPAFGQEGRLPRKYSQEGQMTQSNVSPPVEWYNVPEGTKTMALVVEDIDAPEMGEAAVPWTHWVVENIPAGLKGLPEGWSGKKEMSGEYEKIREGNNDWKTPGWSGPLLPSNTHRIQFKLYALDDEIHVGHNKVSKEKLLDAIDGHILGEALLIAVF